MVERDYSFYLTENEFWDEIFPTLGLAEFRVMGVLMTLKAYDEGQQCYLDFAYLQSLCGLSRQGTYSGIRSLEKKGLLRRRGNGSTYRYIIRSRKPYFDDDAPSLHPGYVYILRSEYGHKIGRTKNLGARLNVFGVKLPFAVQLVRSYSVGDMVAVETRLHRHFSDKRQGGEWFDLSDADIAAIDAMVAEAAR